MMRKILNSTSVTILGAFLTFLPAMAKSQCPDLFPFRYTKCGATGACTSLSKIECTMNPYAPRTDGYSLERWASGSTINYYFRTDEFNGSLNPNPCWLDLNTLSTCFQDAMSAWASLCKSKPVQVNYDQNFTTPCVVSIGVSNPEDPQDFPDPTNEFAVTHTSDNHDCQTGYLVCSRPECPAAYIFLAFNQTNEWRKVYQYVTSCPPDPTCGTLTKKAVNICSIMLHEAGHVFGLQDIKASACQGYQDDKFMAMYGDFSDPKTTCEDLVITPSDACYYRMLYCPDEASVSSSGEQHFDKSLGLSFSPNPSHDRLNVYYDVESGQAYSLEVYSILGEKVESINLTGRSASGFITLQTSNWAPGSYIIRLESKESFIGKLVKVVH